MHISQLLPVQFNSPTSVVQNQAQGNGKPQENVAVSAHKVEFELSQQELAQIRELRTRDREVRAHEQAHASVAGSLARGGPTMNIKEGQMGVNMR